MSDILGEFKNRPKKICNGSFQSKSCIYSAYYAFSDITSVYTQDCSYENLVKFSKLLPQRIYKESHEY